MSLMETIAEDLKAALKTGARERLETLRMARAKMLEAEVNLRAEMGREYKLADPEAIKALASYAKQRRDSIDSYRQAGREDLAAKEEAELAIIQEYLPRQMGPDEVRQIVLDAITEAKATSPKDIGSVMKLVMPKLKGAADGKMVNQIVAELLAGK
ncbi:MAG TPA: GatB/YqeY domain-containing protein [Patescibacteria group bacterium]|nr:GatB/YqeY domain-containing protein [Patescibacteria group bacterium]